MPALQLQGIESIQYVLLARDLPSQRTVGMLAITCKNELLLLCTMQLNLADSLLSVCAFARSARGGEACGCARSGGGSAGGGAGLLAGCPRCTVLQPGTACRCYDSSTLPHRALRLACGSPFPCCVSARASQAVTGCCCTAEGDAPSSKGSAAEQDQKRRAHMQARHCNLMAASGVL